MPKDITHPFASFRDVPRGCRPKTAAPRPRNVRVPYCTSVCPSGRTAVGYRRSTTTPARRTVRRPSPSPCPGRCRRRRCCCPATCFRRCSCRCCGGGGDRVGRVPGSFDCCGP